MEKSEHETRDKEKPKHRTQQDIEKRTLIKTKNQIQEQTETRVLTSVSLKWNGSHKKSCVKAKMMHSLTLVVELFQ